MLNKLFSFVFFEIFFYILMAGITYVSTFLYQTGVPFFQLATLVYLATIIIRLCNATTYIDD